MSERVLVTPDSNISAAGEKVNYWQVAKSFAKNRIMISVVLAYVTTKLFTQPVATINQYVFMVYFQDTSVLSLTALTSMIPMVLGMILIKPLVKKFGKKNLVTWPVLFSAACYGLTAILPMTPMTWIICQLGATVGAIGTGLLQWSLISDAVDYQAYLTGVRNDGTVYATITFIVFFAASAATSIVAVMLELLGYDPALGSMNQLPGVAERIKFFGGAWPLIGSLIIFACYKLIYNIGDDEMRKVSAAVKAMADEKEAKAMAQMEQ
jgi:GPH family glycoside/pentoside/hexuronide:cation symporter